MKNRVCIIIVVKDNLAPFEQCLEGLRQFLTPSDQAFIMDNDSKDRERILGLKEEYSNFQWHLNPINLGFSEGNHLGVLWAQQQKYKYILLLNPDTVIFQESIPELIKASAELNDEWILGPLLVRSAQEKDPTIDSAGLYLDRFYRALDRYQGIRLSQTSITEELLPAKGICGAGMLIPAKLFPLREKAAHHIFLEDFFAYFEDAEFSLYWRKKGGQFAIVPKSRVTHLRKGGSQLGAINFKQWKKNPMIIRKIIMNRYHTLVLHESGQDFLYRFPAFFCYEVARFAYLSLRRPYLVPLTLEGWMLLFQRYILQKRPPFS